MVAVSGGVDSVVLLDVLAKNPSLNLTVAHFDHGIRPDSAEDRKFVQHLAEDKYGLPFVFDEGHLGAGASEAVAREARYAFLRRVKEASGARAIITAHHKDDVLETALINIARGTGRKGLSSLKSTDEVVRPLLAYTKSELVAYAQEQGLAWREDPTNKQDAYLRNRIRHKLHDVPPERKDYLHAIIKRSRAINEEIDQILQQHLTDAGQLERHWFIMLPHAVAREVMAQWMRQAGATFNAGMVERLVVAGKTMLPNRRVDVDNTYQLVVGRDELALKPRDR